MRNIKTVGAAVSCLPLRVLLCTALLMPLLAGCAGRKPELIIPGEAQPKAQDVVIAGAPLEEQAAAAKETGEALEGASSGPEEVIREEEKQIIVHVCGAVVSEGVYGLAADARVADAVLAAGGFTDEADASFVNQAAFLVDGCRLKIPTKEETALSQEAPVLLTVGTEQTPVDGLVVITGGAARAEGGKININTASAQELCSLNGIGPARAADIVRYREEHGPFAGIEDLMQVGGIKQGLFDKIREQITV